MNALRSLVSSLFALVLLEASISCTAAERVYLAGFWPLLKG
jgi:hypothetical protein